MEGDYRKAGVEGNWGEKVRDRRQWREITGRREWRGTGERTSETEECVGRFHRRREKMCTEQGKNDNQGDSATFIAAVLLIVRLDISFSRSRVDFVIAAKNVTS